MVANNVVQSDYKWNKQNYFPHIRTFLFAQQKDIEVSLYQTDG